MLDIDMLVVNYVIIKFVFIDFVDSYIFWVLKGSIIFL